VTANPLLSILAWSAFAILGLVAVARWLRWRSAAVRHARATRGEAFVHGVVEADAAPVTVEVDQHRSKDGTWEQTAVRARIAPFGLRSPSGDVIRVEPDRNAVLMWSPDQTHGDPARPANHTRVAQLVPGATVHVLGTLAPAARDGAPYRDGSTAILTPPGRGPMLISKIPLRTQYARMAAYQVRRIGPAFGIWLLLHALIGGLWRSDLALLGVASAPAWVAVGVAIAGVLIAVATQGGPPPWSIGPLDEAGARATPRKK
jgi:hypothetical protein